MYENGSGFARAESLPYGRGSEGWGCLIKGDLIHEKINSWGCWQEKYLFPSPGKLETQGKKIK